MRHVIIDASIVVQHVVADIHTAYVDRLFDEVGSTITAHIPEFCLLECINVVWKQVRFNHTDVQVALMQTQNLQALDLRIEPISILLPRALEVGLKYQLAVYDSIYIVMAQELGYPLITDDKKQANAAKSEGITLKAITDFMPI